MVGGSNGVLNQLGLGRLRGFRLALRGRTRGRYGRELNFGGDQIGARRINLRLDGTTITYLNISRRKTLGRECA